MNNPLVLSILSGIGGLAVGVIIMVITSRLGLNRDQQKAKLLLEEATIKSENLVRQAVLDGRTQAYELKLAAEHKFGIYAETVKNNADISEEDKKYIFDQLMANFNGECSEVGMYLAMARVAHREGYPEIGLYWEKAAYEEAEHAAKFAELLGEVLTDSTKKNLEMRVEAENGATAGKMDLAKKAKELGLDAIHDTVHEMARDEARHGKAFAGLLARYFK